MQGVHQRPPTGRQIVGRAMELSQLHIVALYEPESGEILHRHTIAVIKGGEEVTEDVAVERAFAKAKRFYERLKSDPAQMRKLAAEGRELFPIDKLKVAVSNDADHLEADLKVDAKTGKIRVDDDEAPRSDHRPAKD